MFKHKTKYKMLSVNKGHCVFCKVGPIREEEIGKLYQLNDLCCHYYCLLFSCTLEQNGEDEEGILGFLYPDIVQEVTRAKKVVCVYCSKVGASIGCYTKKCRRSYHFVCGLDSDALFVFSGDFRSQCVIHRKFQQGFGIGEQFDCPVCTDAIVADPKKALWAPCCKRKSWFHIICLKKLALSAGYFFKCPLCNDKDLFCEEMKKNGIYIPEQDASWEMVPNAYRELLERPNHCSAPKCKYVQGRHKEAPGPLWRIILCSTCGSIGTHLKCSKLSPNVKEWHCWDCNSILMAAGLPKQKQKYRRKSEDSDISFTNIRTFPLVIDSDLSDDDCITIDDDDNDDIYAASETEVQLVDCTAEPSSSSSIHPVTSDPGAGVDDEPKVDLFWDANVNSLPVPRDVIIRDLEENGEDLDQFLLEMKCYALFAKQKMAKLRLTASDMIKMSKEVSSSYVLSVGDISKFIRCNMTIERMCLVRKIFMVVFALRESAVLASASSKKLKASVPEITRYLQSSSANKKVAELSLPSLVNHTHTDKSCDNQELAKREPCTSGEDGTLTCRFHKASHDVCSKKIDQRRLLSKVNGTARITPHWEELSAKGKLKFEEKVLQRAQCRNFSVVLERCVINSNPKLQLYVRRNAIRAEGKGVLFRVKKPDEVCKRWLSERAMKQKKLKKIPPAEVLQATNDDGKGIECEIYCDDRKFAHLGLHHVFTRRSHTTEEKILAENYVPCNTLDFWFIQKSSKDNYCEVTKTKEKTYDNDLDIFASEFFSETDICYNASVNAAGIENCKMNESLWLQHSGLVSGSDKSGSVLKEHHVSECGDSNSSESSGINSPDIVNTSGQRKTAANIVLESQKAVQVKRKRDENVANDINHGRKRKRKWGLLQQKNTLLSGVAKYSLATSSLKNAELCCDTSSLNMDFVQETSNVHGIKGGKTSGSPAELHSVKRPNTLVEGIGSDSSKHGALGKTYCPVKWSRHRRRKGWRKKSQDMNSKVQCSTGAFSKRQVNHDVPQQHGKNNYTEECKKHVRDDSGINSMLNFFEFHRYSGVYSPDEKSRRKQTHGEGLTEKVERMHDWFNDNTFYNKNGSMSNNDSHSLSSVLHNDGHSGQTQSKLDYVDLRNQNICTSYSEEDVTKFMHSYSLFKFRQNSHQENSSDLGHMKDSRWADSRHIKDSRWADSRHIKDSRWVDSKHIKNSRSADSWKESRGRTLKEAMVELQSANSPLENAVEYFHSESGGHEVPVNHGIKWKRQQRNNRWFRKSQKENCKRKFFNGKFGKGPFGNSSQPGAEMQRNPRNFDGGGSRQSLRAMNSPSQQSILYWFQRASK